MYAGPQNLDQEIRSTLHGSVLKVKRAGQRKIRSGEFKATVAIAALREQERWSQLSSRFTVNTTQIHAWQRPLFADAAR